jgi:hypothetical protein
MASTRGIGLDPSAAQVLVDHFRFIDAIARHDKGAQEQVFRRIQEGEGEDTLQALCLFGKKLNESEGTDARKTLEAVLRSYKSDAPQRERKTLIELGTSLLVEAEPRSAFETISRLSESGVSGDELANSLLGLMFVAGIAVDRLGVTMVFDA